MLIIALQQSQQGRRKTQACSDILTLHENQRNETNEIKETRETKESFLLGNFGKKWKSACHPITYLSRKSACLYPMPWRTDTLSCVNCFGFGLHEAKIQK